MQTDEGGRAASWPAVPAGEGDVDRLIAALKALRSGLDEVRFVLPLRGGEDAAVIASGLANQIDDYLVPRLSRPETPPLLVIGGSTGGGKSTLLNTLVGAPVSPAGVLRPTTRSPVLVCHPDDYGTFLVGGPLPSLPRSGNGTPGTLRVLESDALPPSLALVDTPDVDSVEAGNRRLAARLLNAADLWIFVTTAARYADAVPWELLRSAIARDASVLIVLSRVNHLAHATVSTHFREMLRAEGLGAASLFVVEQVTLEEGGLLPEQAVRSLRLWTSRLSASPERRADLIRTTVTGALAALGDQVDAVVEATRAQQGAVTTLRGQIGQVYAAAEARLRASVEDGVLFRGDVVGRWQEYAGNGGLTAILDARSGSKSGVLSGQASIRAARVRAGLVGGVVRLFTSVADEAAEDLAAAWRINPGGAAAAEAVAGRTSSAEPRSAEGAKRAEDATRAWLDHVDASIARADGSMRAGVVPVVVAAALEHGTLPVGREVDVAGGTVTLPADLLAEVFEDEAVRTAGRAAREDLLDRLTTALGAEKQRFADLLDELEPPVGLVDRLRDAARAVERHRPVVAELFRASSTELRPQPAPDARPGTEPASNSTGDGAAASPAGAEETSAVPGEGSTTDGRSELPSVATLQAVAAALQSSRTLDLRPATSPGAPASDGHRTGSDPRAPQSDGDTAPREEPETGSPDGVAEPVDRSPDRPDGD